MSANESVDTEEFWEDLLAYIEDGRVIPVIGTGLLRVEDGGESVPFYDAVARRLLTKYGLPIDFAANEQMRGDLVSDAVARIASPKRPLEKLYRPVHEIIEEVAALAPASTPALEAIARIRPFQLFATTTPDRLLARAINRVRFEGAELTDEIEFAPKLPTERRRDLPPTLTTQYAGVLHLFGRSDVQPFFAIHEEDTLEFAYTLQHGGGPERFFAKLQGSNLLFLGCSFSEWLSRFFLRMSVSERLYSNQRPSGEFIVDRAEGAAGRLNEFLQRFSQNSRFLAADPAEFAIELGERWAKRNPETQAAPSAAASVPIATTSSGSIFVSYATEDAPAARKVYDALQAIGADVAWYDKSALQPGDDWNERIGTAIQKCDMFIPIISRQTDRRTEGYFRFEWKKAAERTEFIQGRRFLFPLVVDHDAPKEDDSDRANLGAYANIPPAFRAAQAVLAPGGVLPDSLRTELTRQVRERRRERMA